MKNSINFILAIFLFASIATFAQSPHAAQLYGMTQYGGSNFRGTIFHYTPSTQTYTVDYEFQIKAKGKSPKCEIVSGNNGKYYGTTAEGGAFNAGVIFEWDSATSEYHEPYHFTGTEGSDSRGAMILYNGNFYGMTNTGGANNFGVIYEYDFATNIYTKKIDMDSINGKNPDGSLTLVGNKFYGFTHNGGINDKGVLFEWDPSTNIYIKDYDFDSINGSNPVGKLTEYNGKLYAMTNTGGTNNLGVIYEWNYSTNVYTKKFDFDNTNGAHPMGYLTLYNNKFYGITYDGGIYAPTNPSLNFGVIFEYNPSSNVFIKKQDLGIQGAVNSHGSLTSLTLKGNVFWGNTTQGGGIFSWNPATNLFTPQFISYGVQCEIDRWDQGTTGYGALFTSGDYLLGANADGGGHAAGCIYKFFPDSNRMASTVHMQTSDGAYPKGSLTKIGNKLYGLTFQGGNNHSGNIFEWDLNTHQFTELLQLNGFITGTQPKGSLVFYNGKLYGINTYGKTNASAGYNKQQGGEIFSWEPSTNIYQTRGFANYARGTPTLFNNKFYIPTEATNSLLQFDPSNDSISEVAFLPPNTGTFNNYQDYISANSVTYYNGKLYGLTPAKYNSGAIPFRGTIYEWDTTTTVMAHQIDFADSIGVYPTGDLLLVGNEFYGLTSGVASNYGNALFKYSPATNLLQKKSLYISGYTYGTPMLSGGKIYYTSESSYSMVYEYDPITDTTILGAQVQLPMLFSGTWNSNCALPPSYLKLLEVIPNQDPLLLNIPTTQTACSNQNNTVTFTLSDADNDTMSFQIANSDTNLIPLQNISITNVDSIYTINYSSVNNQTGSDTIFIIANDGYGSFVNFSFIVNVNASPDVSITQNSTTLTANQNGAIYQWIDCSNNTAVVNAINQSFTATSNGIYAVVITTNNCSDTSACITITTVGTNEIDLQNNITIQPNPAHDKITIISKQTDFSKIEIINALGEIVLQRKKLGNQLDIDVGKLPTAIYQVKIYCDENVVMKKFVKE